jgi:hypothetical protein
MALEQPNTLQPAFSTNVQISWIDEFGSLVSGTLHYADFYTYALTVEASWFLSRTWHRRLPAQ